MSATEPNDPRQTPIEPDREMNADGPKAAAGAPLWRPETDQSEPTEGVGETASTAWARPLANTQPATTGQDYPPAPIAPDPPWSNPTGFWQAQAPQQYGPTSQYGAPQYAMPQPPAPPGLPPQYKPWAPAVAAPPPFAGPPRQQGTARRLGPLVLAVALLSASLSAVGTYVAFSLTSKPAAVVTTSTGQPGNAQLISLTQSDAIVRVANLVKPSVVTITSDGASGVTPFSVPASGVGSGFIVTANGLILTNNHVIAGASTLTVTLDDTRQLPATVVTTDAAHDLALIKVNATGLTPVTLGDSSSIQVGQLAIAIGSPLGTFTDSVTQGIVSGTNRSITVGDRSTRTQESLSGLIQTDAAINPGNSGGPLLDASGSVVGIITASASNAQDMGFAIPINQAKQMIAAAAKWLPDGPGP